MWRIRDRKDRNSGTRRGLYPQLGEIVEEFMDKAKASVDAQKKKFGFSRRLAALTLGIQRVADAKAARGLFP